MRRALLATSAIVAFALATYACGGDDDTSSTIPPNNDAGGSSSGKTSSSSSGNTTSSSGTSGTSGTSSGTSGTSSGTSGTTSSGGNTSNGGVPPIDDAGSVNDGSSIADSGTPDASEADGSAGALCQVGSIQESETNDTPGTADELHGDHPKFCGSVLLIDTDYITFTLPVDASGFSLAASSTDAINISGTIDGGNEFTVIGQDAGAKIPIVPGGKYVLKVTTTAVKSDYILQLDVEHSPKSSKCEASSTQETEDNASTPNTMPVGDPPATPSFCGTINTKDDVDKFQFMLTDSVKDFTFDFASTGQNFSLKMDVDGQSFTISPPPAGKLEVPLVVGKPYVLTASSQTPNNGYVFHLITTKKP